MLLPRGCSYTVLLFVVLGCGQSAPMSQVIVQSDSSGVRVVQHAGLPDVWWTVGPKAQLVIGADDQRQGHALHRVSSATRLVSGYVAIADAGSKHVSLYSDTGELLTTFAESGGGPGEFDGFSQLEVLPSVDTIFVTGETSRRRKVAGFSESGRLLTEWIALEPIPRRGAWYASSTARTGHTFAVLERLPQNEQECRTVCRRPAHIVRVSGSGPAHDTVAIYPGTSYFYADVGPRPAFGGGSVSGPRPLSPILSPMTTLAAGGEPYRLVVGDQGVSAYDVYDLSGTLQQRVRWQTPSRTPSTEDIESIRADYVASYGQSDLSTGERAWAAMPEVGLTATFRTLHVDRTGNVWIQRAPLPTDAHQVWWVFSSTGTYRASVRLEPEARILEAGQDYILLLVRDEFDVQRVELWPLDASQGGT